MLATVSADMVELDVLAGRRRAVRSIWSASLSRFFEISRQTLQRVSVEIKAGCLETQAFLKGNAEEVGLGERVIDDLLTNCPLSLTSPFEDTASIAGGVWSGRVLFGPDFDDALAKLAFSAGTQDLPMHMHEFSDRFIVVAAGRGHFWWSEQRLDSFNGLSVHSVGVQQGDLLLFTRGLLHTFSAPLDELLLLSFHSPEIPFDDPRQFTLPQTLWTPRMIKAM